MTQNKLKVLIASAEMAPYSKVGGLADVVGELPPYLEKEGAEVCVFTPLYGCIDEEKWGIEELPNSELTLDMGNSRHVFKLKIAKHPKSKNPRSASTVRCMSTYSRLYASRPLPKG